MTGAMIAELLVKFGPIAISYIEKLIEVWNKEMTPEEVKALCLSLRKTEADYVKAEEARRATIT